MERLTTKERWGCLPVLGRLRFIKPTPVPVLTQSQAAVEGLVRQNRTACAELRKLLQIHANRMSGVS